MDGDYFLQKLIILEDDDGVALVLSEGVDINCRGDMGLTPLHTAIDVSRLDYVEFLLANGADVTLIDEFGRSARDLAVELGLDEISALF